MEDALGDRMKFYENLDVAGQRLIPLLPIIARIDGRCFSKFTLGLAKPFDLRLSNLMVDTTNFLVNETGACIGYTQSDEITLAWYSDDYKTQHWFNGKVAKMVSHLAALASVYFNSKLPEQLPDKCKLLPTFDARVWNVPNLIEGVNAFIWRQWDARKNSVFSAARCYFSNNELQNRSCDEMVEMLFQQGVKWSDYPDRFKYGTYIQRRIVRGKYNSEELDKLPEKHNARKHPELEIERSKIEIIDTDVPILTRLSNSKEFIFCGEAPIKISEAMNA